MLRQVVARGHRELRRGAGLCGRRQDRHRRQAAPKGGYYDDRVIATFASVFPANDPKYVLVVTLDEPVETSGPEPRRTAGWTAVPVGRGDHPPHRAAAGAAARRLNSRAATGVTLTAN